MYGELRVLLTGKTTK